LARNVQPRHAAGGARGARKFQGGLATATADIHHPFADTRSGEDKQGVRHRRERDVSVLLSSNPDIAAFPFQKASMSALISSRARPFDSSY
jgi:hypothetical protein